MTQYGTCGPTRANEGCLIPFLPLWQTSFNFWPTSSVWESSTVQLTCTDPPYLRLILPSMLLLVSIQLSRGSGCPEDFILLQVWRQSTVSCRKFMKRIKTQGLRYKVNREKGLLVFFRKPHIKPAGSASISQWIKTVLNSAGTDSIHFKALSVRSAATSAAMGSGVSVKDIMSIADWSRESAFSRVYHKSTCTYKLTFGQALLKGYYLLRCTSLPSLSLLMI